MNETLDPDRSALLLMEAISTTFADMAFVDIEPTRAERIAAAIESPVRAAIDVLKPLSCRLELECPASLKARVEETLFQGGDSDGEDALLEILNVAAGQFLSAYFGPGTDIKLELPHYLYFSDGSEGEVFASAVGDAEGSPVKAFLRSVRYRY